MKGLFVLQELGYKITVSFFIALHIFWILFFSLSLSFICPWRTSFSCSTKALPSWRCLTRLKLTLTCSFSSWTKSSTENEPVGEGEERGRGNGSAFTQSGLLKMFSQKSWNGAWDLWKGKWMEHTKVTRYRPTFSSVLLIANVIYFKEKS